ncbi:SAM-dependent methyltransferase [Lysobacter sp. A3-1-A15]|uniref:SAM-dependent methyltransferase n=1 Tax=Novilysobacter viscosus TaxID=3098602 RepID=UPI002ED82B2B
MTTRRSSPRLFAACLLLALGVAGCNRSGPAAADPTEDVAAPAADTAQTGSGVDATDALQPGSDPFDRTSIAPAGGEPARQVPDVVYVPTPQAVVDVMLDMADVGPADVLVDLGSGDGRIPITAARRWGTRGVGIDIDPDRIREADAGARKAGVADKVDFIQGDMFDADLSDATVVTLYLLPRLNLRLRPALLALDPGTRIVTHNYHMGEWQPEAQRIVGDSVVYAWTVPERTPTLGDDVVD